MGGLRGLGFWWPALAAFPKTQTALLKLLKIVINPQLSSFFILGEIAAGLKNKT